MTTRIGSSIGPHGDALGLPSGAAGILGRIASSTAKTLGYPRVAEIIDKWPEKVGEAIAAPFKKLRAETEAGRAPSAKLEAELQKALTDNPQDAAPLLGIMLADSLGDGLNSSEQRSIVVSSYQRVLEVIGRLVIDLERSVALRGFLHDSCCISYWHCTRIKTVDSAFNRRNDSLCPSSAIEVYFLDHEPSDSNLIELNRKILRSTSRQLDQQLFDYRRDEKVSRLEQVHELTVAVTKLDSDATGKADAAKFRYIAADEHRVPRSKQCEIPFGAPSLAVLVESLFTALEAQAVHNVGLATTLANVDRFLSAKQGKAAR